MLGTIAADNIPHYQQSKAEQDISEVFKQPQNNAVRDECH